MDGELAKIPKLKGVENWGTWKFQVRVILNSHNAWDVANGTETRPAALEANADAAQRTAHERSLALWKKADSMIQKVIATSVGEHPMLHIINCETGREMWHKLSAVYEQRSEFSIHLLQQRWYSATFEGNDDIATYIARLEDLAYRLNLLGEQIPESMVMTKILMTLPPNYRYFVSAWESSPTAERTLVNLTSRLTIEESRNSAQQEAIEGQAFAARAQNWKQRGKFSRNSATLPGKCFECHETGHYARQCPNRRSSSHFENKNSARGSNMAFNRNESKNKSTESGSSNVNSEGNSKPQGQGLVCEALSTIRGNGIKSSDWVLDTGASDHMCNKIEWFSTYEVLKEPRKVRIGNGNLIEAYGKGYINVKMFDETGWNLNHLVDVFYVPDLKYNLFSVGAALDKGLEMVSTRSVCKLVAGDRTVAVGVRRDRLYIMQFEASSVPDSSNNEEDWWQPDLRTDSVLDMEQLEEEVENVLVIQHTDQQPIRNQAEDDILDIVHEQNPGIVPQEDDRRLRNRDLLRRPVRFDDYVGICNVLIAESQEPISYKEVISNTKGRNFKRAMNKEILEKQQHGKGDLPEDEFGCVLVHETYQIAEAQQEKDAKMCESFGISENLVEDSSFDSDRKVNEDSKKSNELQEELQPQTDAECEKNERYALVQTALKEREPGTSENGAVSKDKKKKSKKKKDQQEKAKLAADYPQLQLKTKEQAVYGIAVGDIGKPEGRAENGPEIQIEYQQPIQNRPEDTAFNIYQEQILQANLHEDDRRLQKEN